MRYVKDMFKLLQLSAIASSFTSPHNTEDSDELQSKESNDEKDESDNLSSFFRILIRFHLFIIAFLLAFIIVQHLFCIIGA